ncbi:MAG: adenylate/guanylate cyclase domain-containing protein [Novosphingobium sp.]|nr:adenylate/guanylate cyclase domain-containing protein [Novosphingobium sp.]
MTRSQQARLVVWLTVAVAGGLIGYFYTALSYPLTGVEGAPPLRGMRAGFMIAAATSWFEIFAMRGPVGRWLKAKPLSVSLVVRLLIHTAMIVGLLQFNIRIVSFPGVDIGNVYRPKDMVQDVAFSLLAMSAVLFVIQMRQLVGPRTFRNLLTGRYHQPRSEERIFAIFDIAGSTAIAGKLGDEDFHAFVSQVFFDIDAPIVDDGGEVMSFVGDALIANWPLCAPERNACAIGAAFRVMDVLEARAQDYLHRFGVTPRLRAVLHGGPVVAGETGDSRRQITYLGDVLNVASRIEAVAKQTGAVIVISDSLLARCELPEGVAVRALGSYDLKGVSGPVPVSELAAEAGKGDVPKVAIAAGAHPAS